MSQIHRSPLSPKPPKLAGRHRGARRWLLGAVFGCGFLAWAALPGCQGEVMDRDAGQHDGRPAPDGGDAGQDGRADAGEDAGQDAGERDAGPRELLYSVSGAAAVAGTDTFGKNRLTRDPLDGGCSSSTTGDMNVVNDALGVANWGCEDFHFGQKNEQLVLRHIEDFTYRPPPGRRCTQAYGYVNAQIVGSTELFADGSCRLSLSLSVDGGSAFIWFKVAP